MDPLNQMHMYIVYALDTHLSWNNLDKIQHTFGEERYWDVWWQSFDDNRHFPAPNVYVLYCI